jgi:membrane protein DedA with SNARE-associated domain
MNAVAGALSGPIVKFALMAIVGMACMFGARLGANYLIRQNPQWSKHAKESTHTLATLAAVILLATFIIGIAR